MASAAASNISYAAPSSCIGGAHPSSTSSSSLLSHNVLCNTKNEHRLRGVLPPMLAYEKESDHTNDNSATLHHRQEYFRQAFGVNLQGQPVSQCHNSTGDNIVPKKSRLTVTKYHQIVSLLKKVAANNDEVKLDVDEKKDVRKLLSEGFTIQDNGQEDVVLLQREKIVLPQLHTFDVIAEAHLANSNRNKHLGVRPTHDKLLKDYCTISREMVKVFVRACPECSVKYSSGGRSGRRNVNYGDNLVNNGDFDENVEEDNVVVASASAATVTVSATVLEGGVGSGDNMMVDDEEGMALGETLRKAPTDRVSSISNRNSMRTQLLSPVGERGGGVESSARSSGMTLNINTHQQQCAMKMDLSNRSFSTSRQTSALSQEGRGAKSAIDAEVNENAHQNGIHSITTLSESEVFLCHQLLNLQRTLQMKQPDAQCQQTQQQYQQQYQPSTFSLSRFQRATYQSYTEEENEDDDNDSDDYLMEHIQSMQSREQKRVEKAKKRSAKKRSLRAEDDSNRTAPALVLNETSSKKTTKSVSLSTRKKSSSSSSSASSTAATATTTTTTTKTKTRNPRKQQIDPRALSGIRHPGKHDCLNGRGGAINMHPGNIKFRLIIEERKEAYRSCNHVQKAILAKQVVNYWRGMDPPGRFLKFNEVSGMWDDIGNKDAQKKCLKTLREREASKLRLLDVGCEEEEDQESIQSREQNLAEKAKKRSAKKRSRRAEDDSNRSPGCPNKKRAAPALVLTARMKSSSPTTTTKTKTSDLRKQHIVQSTNSTRNATFCDPMALSGTRHPGKHDCLNGRGGAINMHPGNIKFRLIIEERKEAYRSCNRSQRPILAMQVVNYWRGMDPPGRFLKFDEVSGMWDDIGNKDAQKKCLKTLREREASKSRLSNVGCDEEENDESDNEEDAE